ncbi:transcriptional regulator, TetR family [Paenibacillus sophorae]|uniref:TetR/AcrR family transcriptional regulator n=1 Tax=Paenibacillus sophorae TaxID=1333845 RepID=A0A1H8U688_9BACL|nr:TetR/AcrR family transcriptional regulator [Paenibacillus sophorae]QWU17961.1 TetR/AcrR family transcriptional regulator [Paenibacillus sophorae]SEO98596.1 transcriptional regulator, TetR family [Paenibacillus sophorae]
MSKNDKISEQAGNLSVGAALSWGLVEPPKRGPKRELSIPLIVETAVSIADKEGLSAVSMNRVASALGFTAMSLYRYIPSKGDLLLLMQEAVCDIPIPPEKKEEDWRGSMREFVSATIQVFRDHPWFGDVPISGIPVTPNNLRVVDWALRPMREFPLNDYEKMSIVLLLSSYARSCGLIQRDMDQAIQAGARPDEFSGLDYTATLKGLIKPEQYPNLYPVVMSGAYTGENEEENTVGNDFDFGLERILDGIAYYLDLRRK